MNKFAVWIVAGIEMRTVSEAFISVLIDYGSKVLFITVCMSLCFLAFISRAMVAILNIFLGLELQSLNFF
jgi:hypothetical protein